MKPLRLQHHMILLWTIRYYFNNRTNVTGTNVTRKIAIPRMPRTPTRPINAFFQVNEVMQNAQTRFKYDLSKEAEMLLSFYECIPPPPSKKDTTDTITPPSSS